MEALEARYAENEKQIQGLKDATDKLSTNLSSFINGAQSQLKGVRDWLDRSVATDERQSALHTREDNILEDVSRKMDLFRSHQQEIDAKYDALAASMLNLQRSPHVSSETYIRERHPRLWTLINEKVGEGVDSLLQDWLGGYPGIESAVAGEEKEPYQQRDDLAPHAGLDDDEEDKMDQDDPSPSHPAMTEGHQPAEDDDDPSAPAPGATPAHNISSSQALRGSSRSALNTPTRRPQQGEYAENNDDNNTPPVKSSYLRTTYQVLILLSLGKVE